MIPTRGRDDQLRRCLEALCLLEYPREQFEAIVIADGDRTSLDDLGRDFGSRIRVTVAAQPHRGPAAARNAGAALAAFEILAFTDDDCRPTPEWLSVLADAFDRDPGAAIGGRVVNAHPGNRFAEASTALVDFIASVHNADPERARFATSNNLAVPADAFRGLGGFDPRFTLAAGEDRDFCDRWCRDGRPLRWRPEAIVRHDRALDLRRFLRQHFAYGRGAYRFRHGRAVRLAERLSLEPPSFYVALLREPATGRRALEAAALVTLLGISQVMTLAGFAVERLADRRSGARDGR